MHPGKRLDYLKSVQDTDQSGLDRCVSYAPRQPCPWVPSIVSLVPPHSPVMRQPLSQGAPAPCWEPHLGPWRAPKAALSWSGASASLRMCTPVSRRRKWEVHLRHHALHNGVRAPVPCGLSHHTHAASPPGWEQGHSTGHTTCGTTAQPAK